jgi:hypothetical protein
VEAKKAGRSQAWRATWPSDASGGRVVEVWRVHVPESEMLYNVSFSAARGGLSGGYVRLLGGYPQPHEAGRVHLRQLDPRYAYQLPDGSAVPGTDSAGLLQMAWGEAAATLGEVGKKPKAKAARHAGLKGDALEVEVRTKDNLPMVWYGFCGKHKQDMVLITICVDERETRLHKDLFKTMDTRRSGARHKTAGT